jgi:hypothetical protein
MMKWKEQLNGDCPRRDAHGLHERCDLICPERVRQYGNGCLRRNNFAQQFESLEDKLCRHYCRASDVTGWPARPDEIRAGACGWTSGRIRRCRLRSHAGLLGGAHPSRRQLLTARCVVQSRDPTKVSRRKRHASGLLPQLTSLAVPEAGAPLLADPRANLSVEHMCHPEIRVHHPITGSLPPCSRWLRTSL